MRALKRFKLWLFKEFSEGDDVAQVVTIPLFMVTFVIGLKWIELDPWILHVVSYFVYLILTFVLFLMVSKVIRKAMGQKNKIVNRGYGSLAMLIGAIVIYFFI